MDIEYSFEIHEDNYLKYPINKKINLNETLRTK